MWLYLEAIIQLGLYQMKVAELGAVLDVAVHYIKQVVFKPNLWSQFTL